MSVWYRRRDTDRFTGDGGAVAERRLRDSHELLGALVLLERRARGEQAVRLQPEELSPGRSDPAGRRAEAVPAKHRGDGRGRDVDAELQELASDPEVAPPGILPSESKDQALDRGIERRATGPTGPAPAPPPRELSVPPDEGVRAHHEALPSIPGQQPGSRCQERPICIGEARSDPSSTEDLQLVAEYGRLQISLVEAAAQEHANQAADEPVAHRNEHQSKSERRSPHPLTARSGGPIEFLYPTRSLDLSGDSLADVDDTRGIRPRCRLCPLAAPGTPATLASEAP